MPVSRDASFAPYARKDAVREGVSLVEALDAFIFDTRSRCAPLTATTYERRLRPLRALEWPLTSQVCRELIASQVQQGFAPATIDTFRGALMSFVKFCRAEGYIYDDPTARLRSPKIEHKPHRYLTHDQIALLRSHLKPDERLMFELLQTGLRAAEVLSLKAEDVDDGLILVRGKGARWRYVPLPPLAVLPATGVLVPFSYRTMRNRIVALGKRAGIARLHAHLFRHSFASNGIERTDMLTVQVVGGWASDQMLRRYAESTLQKAAARKAARLFE